jgi:hypothetical protein
LQASGLFDMTKIQFKSQKKAILTSFASDRGVRNTSDNEKSITEDQVVIEVGLGIFEW